MPNIENTIDTAKVMTAPSDSPSVNNLITEMANEGAKFAGTLEKASNAIYLVESLAKYKYIPLALILLTAAVCWTVSNASGSVFPTTVFTAITVPLLIAFAVIMVLSAQTKKKLHALMQTKMPLPQEGIIRERDEVEKLLRKKPELIAMVSCLNIDYLVLKDEEKEKTVNLFAAEIEMKPSGDGEWHFVKKGDTLTYIEFPRPDGFKFYRLKLQFMANEDAKKGGTEK